MKEGGGLCNPIKSVRIIKLKLEKYQRGDDSQVLLKRIKLQFCGKEHEQYQMFSFHPVRGLLYRC